MSAQTWTDEPDLVELRQAYDLLTVDPPQAIERLKLLAARGSTMSMIYIAKSYATGDSSKENFLEAENWYREAASKGSDFALYSLGKLYMKAGESVKAKEIFASKALQDYLPAIHELGRMYHHGIGTEKDLTLAKRLLEKAAAQGHVFAMRELAGMLSRGGYGLLQVPRGLYLFIKSIVSMIRILKTDSPHSEKIS
jgi:uncharacterized protein